MKINKELVPMKAHFFFFNAAMAPVVPFMPPLARQLGFSSFNIGKIYFVLPFIGMFCKPIFCALGDRKHINKQIFIGTQILAAISLFSIIFIPPIIRDDSITVDFLCHEHENDIQYHSTSVKTKSLCSEDDDNIQLMNCNLKCISNTNLWNTICDRWDIFNKNDNCPTNEPYFNLKAELSLQPFDEIESHAHFKIQSAEFNNKNINLYCPINIYLFNETFFHTQCYMSCPDMYMEIKEVKDDAYEYYQYWIFFVLMIIGWSSLAVIVSIGDAICFGLLGNRPYSYGHQRLWGSVGWGLFSIIAGICVDTMSGSDIRKNYNIVFFMLITLFSFDAFTSSKLKYEQIAYSERTFKDVKRLFLKPRVFLYLFWTSSCGLCMALVWMFLLIHLEILSSNDCEARLYIKTLQGLVMGIQSFGGELPFFFLSSRILKTIGHIYAMAIVLFTFGVRFILYSLLTNPWWVLPIEFLNGITFGIFFATMASYANILAPPGAAATLQGLVGAFFEGGGIALGSLLGGYLFKKIGGKNTFYYFGCFSFASFAVFMIFHYILSAFEKRHDNAVIEEN